MSESLIGSQLAGYRIERVLGRGGMAAIYFAWDTLNNRPVALKVMDERYRGTPAYVERFIHEAQAIATWNHPNIVSVYDAGEQGGIYFYAMEFIRGLDLAQLLRQYLDAGQLLPYKEVVRIGWAVASALDFAHAQGIIHRDVKPSNVLISVDGRVLLSDFGLVMDISRGTLGETFGSPHYIAPEQARSSAGAVPQSDLYALAVMLYEMLTGALPFDDPSPTTLALLHLNQEPPRPRALNPRLNAAVESVLLRGLRKRPEERFATGREMMQALQGSLAAELQDPQAAQPLPVLPSTEQFREERRQPQPGATAVYPAGSMPAPVASIPRPAEPRATVDGAPPTGPLPAYQPAATPPPPYPPAAKRRARGFGWGCLAAALALPLLLVVIGAALVFSNPGWFIDPTRWTIVATNPSSAPTQATPPTLTVTPEPSQTLQPTLTPTLPPTQTPTFTPVPPSATPTPTATALVVAVRLARAGSAGFVLANTGLAPIPLAPLVLADTDGGEFSAAEWQVAILQPGQCVLAWEPDTAPQVPDDLTCEPVGQVVLRAGDERFWTRNLTLRYNGIEIATCPNDRDRCDVEVR
jgi:serine/threonine protein kinase